VRRLLVLACGLVLGSTGADVGAGARQVKPLPTIAPSCVDSSFPSGDGKVRARLCLPVGASKTNRVPAVVVLHGCGGFGVVDEVLTRDLPRHGIATSLVDYFGLTPPPSRLKGFCRAHLGLEQAFATWERITIDATRALEHRPEVDPGRIGAIGWSLGGGLVLQTAQSRPRLLRVLVLVSTGTFDAKLANVRRLPPTLVLSAGKGEGLSAPYIVALYRTLRRAGVTAELRVFPDGDHAWKRPGQTAALERWTADFLERHLVA